MATENYTLNLTVPFLTWTVIWLIIAAFTGFQTWTVVLAALPWIFVCIFAVITFIIVLVMWYRVTHGYFNPRLSVKVQGKEKNPHHRN